MREIMKKFVAAGLAAVCLLGTVSPVSAGTKTVTSTYPQGLQSTSVAPATDVNMYGSASCTTGTAVGHITQWSARMWGSMALAYTTGACSFGKNGSATDVMAKSKFVIGGAQLVSYSKEASMFTYYNSATTTLYY